MMAAFFPWSSYWLEATDDQNKDGLVSKRQQAQIWISGSLYYMKSDEVIARQFFLITIYMNPII